MLFLGGKKVAQLSSAYCFSERRKCLLSRILITGAKRSAKKTKLVFELSFSIVYPFYICSLVYVDGKFCSNCWNDIVLTLHFSRWHLLWAPEARDLCLQWLWRGQWWLPQCCFMTPRPWISHTFPCSICHSSNTDNISIPLSLAVLIVTSWDWDGVWFAEMCWHMSPCTDKVVRPYDHTTPVHGVHKTTHTTHLSVRWHQNYSLICSRCEIL